MHNTIAARDFSGKTLKALTEKGVRLIGKQAIPADENDRYFSGTAYKLEGIDREIGFMRTWHQVETMAKSSWNLKDFLEDQN